MPLPWDGRRRDGSPGDPPAFVRFEACALAEQRVTRWLPMSAESDTDRVFAALAHPARRRMLDLLVQSPGASVKAVASHFEFSRIAVMKHLATLEAAGLVLSRKEGRTRKLFFNAVPIQQVYDRWTTQYSAFWAERVVDLKGRIEARVHDRKKHA